MNSKFVKLYGGIQITDSMIGVLMAVILMAVVALNFGTLLDFARWGSEKFEINNIQSAAATYKALRSDGASPSSVEDILSGVPAADSIDGVNHTGLLTAKSGRWVNGRYTDAWGQEYQFSTDADGADTITSAGIDRTIGTDDDIIVYY